ncbi:MAG: hypothetical protein IPN95_19595 [Bacteroidetes bacterium]|nr:hypothetical protein [Bacteroidota bacterium]
MPDQTVRDYAVSGAEVVKPDALQALVEEEFLRVQSEAPDLIFCTATHEVPTPPETPRTYSDFRSDIQA